MPLTLQVPVRLSRVPASARQVPVCLVRKRHSRQSSSDYRHCSTAKCLATARRISIAAGAETLSPPQAISKELYSPCFNALLLSGLHLSSALSLSLWMPRSRQSDMAGLHVCMSCMPTRECRMTKPLSSQHLVLHSDSECPEDVPQTSTSSNVSCCTCSSFC